MILKSDDSLQFLLNEELVWRGNKRIIFLVPSIQKVLTDKLSSNRYLSLYTKLMTVLKEVWQSMKYIKNMSHHPKTPTSNNYLKACLSNETLRTEKLRNGSFSLKIAEEDLKTVKIVLSLRVHHLHQESGM